MIPKERQGTGRIISFDLTSRPQAFRFSQNLNRGEQVFHLVLYLVYVTAAAFCWAPFGRLVIVTRPRFTRCNKLPTHSATAPLDASYRDESYSLLVKPPNWHDPPASGGVTGLGDNAALCCLLFYHTPTSSKNRKILAGDGTSIFDSARHDRENSVLDFRMLVDAVDQDWKAASVNTRAKGLHSKNAKKHV
jgi:hypothetical protein